MGRDCVEWQKMYQVVPVSGGGGDNGAGGDEVHQEMQTRPGCLRLGPASQQSRHRCLGSPWGSCFSDPLQHPPTVSSASAKILSTLT